MARYEKTRLTWAPSYNAALESNLEPEEAVHVREEAMWVEWGRDRSDGRGGFAWEGAARVGGWKRKEHEGGKKGRVDLVSSGCNGPV